MKRTSFLLTSLLCLGYASQVLGNTYTVTTTVDEFDLSNGQTSLREAVYLANNNSGADTIQLSAGATYTLTLDGVENASSPAEVGDLDIYESTISIVGNSSNPPTICLGTNPDYFEDRMFHVHPDCRLEVSDTNLEGHEEMMVFPSVDVWLGELVFNDEGEFLASDCAIGPAYNAQPQGSALFSIDGNNWIESCSFEGFYDGIAPSPGSEFTAQPSGLIVVVGTADSSKDGTIDSGYLSITDSEFTDWDLNAVLGLQAEIEVERTSFVGINNQDAGLASREVGLLNLGGLMSCEDTQVIEVAEAFAVFPDEVDPEDESTWYFARTDLERCEATYCVANPRTLDGKYAKCGVVLSIDSHLEMLNCTVSHCELASSPMDDQSAVYSVFYEPAPVSYGVDFTPGVYMDSCTVTYNVMQTTAPDSTYGAGLNGLSPIYDTFDVNNSVVSMNEVVTGAIFAPPHSSNVASDISFGLNSNNHFGPYGSTPETNPGLDSIPAYNGAVYTRTIALLTGSALIDAGATSLSIDQRWESRPYGSADDIGAYEIQETDSGTGSGGSGGGTGGTGGPGGGTGGPGT